MFGRNQGEMLSTERYYLKKQLIGFSSSGYFLSSDRFPIDQRFIDEMPNYLDNINSILVSANIKDIMPISLEDIINLQRIIGIQDKKILLDEFIELETSSMSLALWLYAYLEIRMPIEDFDPKWTDVYHDKATSLMNN